MGLVAVLVMAMPGDRDQAEPDQDHPGGDQQRLQAGLT
jgi:hypothetical protein